MTHEEIVSKVRDILNEHGGDDVLSIAEDRVLLDDYIASAIPDAVVMLASKGHEVNVVYDGRFSIEDAVVDDLGFISLISMKADSWKRTVTRLTEINSDEFAMAQNEFTAPGANTPIVYVEAGNIYAEPYPEGRMTCVYNKKYSADEGLNAGEREALAVCYVTAAIVMGVFGDDAAKQRLNDVATNML